MSYPVSRRSLLRGGAAAGLSALAAARPTTSPAGAARSAERVGRSRLVLNYRPSQPTGWPNSGGFHHSDSTLGGHVAFKDFAFGGRRHRISLLPAPHPVYEPVPTDPILNFRKILDDEFGAHYVFRYTGGLRGNRTFNVQSYGVFAHEPAETTGIGYGGGIYVAYDTGHSGNPDPDDNLNWIQVIASSGGGRPLDIVVDNFGRANPYYPYGGLTSINGNKLVNFADVPQGNIAGAATLDHQILAETFLAQDTGVHDAAGRAIVKVLGGVKWGWKVERIE